jgi:hypothetical protein
MANRDAIYAIGFDNFTARRGMGARQGDGLSAVPAGPASTQNSTYHTNRSIIIPTLTNSSLNEIVGYAANAIQGSFDVIWETSSPAFTGLRVHFTAFGAPVAVDVGSVASTSGLNTVSGLSVGQKRSLHDSGGRSRLPDECLDVPLGRERLGLVCTWRICRRDRGRSRAAEHRAGARIGSSLRWISAPSKCGKRQKV